MEIWKDIIGYEGYQISNTGNIRSIDRHVKRVNKSGRITTYHVNGKILKKCIGSHGYWVVNLWFENKFRQMLLHRLLALYFIENKSNGNYINHKDGNRQNNDLNNLEWCTCSENYQHAINVLGKSSSPKKPSSGKNHYMSRKIIALLPNGHKENFDCITDAVTKYKLSSGNTTSVLRGRRSHTKGIKLFYCD